MPHTAQILIDKWRILVGETDKDNSRWKDPIHGLYYVNLGRREWAKETQAVKAIFEQLSSVGATLGNTSARYVLDPTLFEIDNIYWDGHEVERGSVNEFEEQTLNFKLDTKGVPYVYRRIGDSIDLFFAPESAKVIEIHASVIPIDFPNIASADTELSEDQGQGAILYAAFQALQDDNRDGSTFFNQFRNHTKKYTKIKRNTGPRYVEMSQEA